MGYPSKAIQYLREKEWTMGNGQCHECCGCGPDFDNPNGIIYREQGHEPFCKIAAALDEAGENVFYSQMEIERHFKVEKNRREWLMRFARKPIGV